MAPQDDRLKDRIAVITGASSGLGQATALRFADSGARIVCADVNPSSVVETITAKHGPDAATFVKCDVTKETDIEALIAAAAKWGRRVDILCTYAGVGIEAKYVMTARAHEIETKDFDLTFAINTRGVWLCCKYALKQMMAQEPRAPNARGERTRGWIVNAASMLGLVGTEGAPCYVPSKHAVVGMTKQMALDYAQDRIHVNCLCPGFVKTAMIKPLLVEDNSESDLAAAHPWNALGRAEDIADAALFLASDDAAWVSGHAMVIDGGYTAR